MEKLLLSLVSLLSINIDKAEDVGNGMYNFYFYPNNKIFRDRKYSGDMIFQTYPNPKDEHYGSAFIIMYYHTDGNDEWDYQWDNHCIEWENLTEKEKKEFARDIIDSLVF